MAKEKEEPRKSPGVTNGAELVKKLRDSGTGDQKINTLREFLAVSYEANKKIPTAEQVFEFMQGHNYFHEGTLKKAKQLMTYGSIEEALAVEPELQVPIEDVMLGSGGTNESVKQAQSAQVGDPHLHNIMTGKEPLDPATKPLVETPPKPLVDSHGKPLAGKSTEDDDFDAKGKKGHR